MPGLVTEAIVLHAFDYLETSRIMRLLTREAGVQSVLARGARSSRRRFGGAMDLFAQGTAPAGLRLTGSTTTGTGVIYATYEHVGKPVHGSIA